MDAAENLSHESASEVTRERSTISFPYLDLDDAIEVTKAVHGVGGTNCQWDQLAAKLNGAAKGGGFRLRVLTAKIFGLLLYDKGTVTLTEMGLRAADARQEALARVEAFLSVPLYKRIYEEFKGATLPGSSGIETFIVGVGVAQKQKDKARQVFQRSARQAGFFDLSEDRLTIPALKNGKSSLDKDSTQENVNRGEGAGDGGSGSSGTSRTISLRSGGTLTVSATLDLFSLSPPDRKFVFEFIDKLESYESEDANSGHDSARVRDEVSA